MSVDMGAARGKASAQVPRFLTAISACDLTGELLVERELCELIGASRSPVREALRQLESEGLVSSITGKGTAVSSVIVEEARPLSPATADAGLYPGPAAKP